MRHYPAFSTAMELTAKAALYSDVLSSKLIGRAPSTYLLPVNDALSKVAPELGKAPAGGCSNQTTFAPSSWLWVQEYGCNSMHTCCLAFISQGSRHASLAGYHTCVLKAVLLHGVCCRSAGGFLEVSHHRGLCAIDYAVLP